MNTKLEKKQEDWETGDDQEVEEVEKKTSLNMQEVGKIGGNIFEEAVCGEEKEI